MDELTGYVLAAQQGDHNAFGHIVTQFQDMAYAVGYARVGSPEAAEEIAQEAFIEAYRHLEQISNPAAFPGWFRTIVTRQCNRVLRRARAPLVPLEAMATAAAQQPEPNALAEAREQQVLIHTAIATLPEHERDVVALFYLAEYAQKEIAELLDIRVSTVKNRLFSARKRLYQQLTSSERMIDMVTETAQQTRPSQDDAFVTRVMEFIAATELGNTAKVAEMLTATPNLANTKGAARYAHEELYPLHNAAVYGYKEIAEHLLDHGADINATSAIGWTPLLSALMTEQHEVVEFLLARGATVDIFAAARMGDVVQVQAFLQEDAELARARGPRGATPLHFASTVPVAQCLVEHGADVNAKDESGSERQRYGTPLRWNADNGAVAQYLLSQGAEVDDVFLACALGNVKQVKAFLREDPAAAHAPQGPYQGELLHLAADKGQVEIVQLLLEAGSNVDAPSAEGSVTPLHLAASSGRVDAVRLLLDNGADPNARDTEMQSTPLGWARFWQQDEVVRLLN